MKIKKNESFQLFGLMKMEEDGKCCGWSFPGQQILYSQIGRKRMGENIYHIEFTIFSLFYYNIFIIFWYNKDIAINLFKITFSIISLFHYLYWTRMIKNWNIFLLFSHFLFSHFFHLSTKQKKLFSNISKCSPISNLVGPSQVTPMDIVQCKIKRTHMLWPISQYNISIILLYCETLTKNYPPILEWVAT